MSDKKYLFEEITHCEMCGNLTAGHKIMGQRLNTTQGFRPKKRTGISVSIKKCRNCNLIYSSPQPIPFDIQDHYDVPPESYWTPEYFTLSPTYYGDEIKKLRELREITGGMTALDVGAGIGKCMIALKNAGFDVYGFEPAKSFYEHALSNMHIPSDRLKFGKVEDVEYATDYFDFITFGAVFEHIYHPVKSLEKALGWLKPGGIIHIEVPSSKHLIAKIFDAYYTIMGTNYTTHTSPMHTPFHLYEFDYKSFTHVAARLGCKVLAHEYTVGDIYHIPRFLHTPLRKIMKWTDTGMQLTVWLTKD